MNENRISRLIWLRTIYKYGSEQGSLAIIGRKEKTISLYIYVNVFNFYLIKLRFQTILLLTEFDQILVSYRKISSLLSDKGGQKRNQVSGLR